MQSFDFKKFLPHLYILAGFALLALIFCYPAVHGMKLSQHDTISWKAMYHEAEAYHDSTGNNALWTNSMFGGMPTYTIGIPEAHNYAWKVHDFFAAVLVTPAHFIFLAMLGFYLLMNAMRIDRWLGAAGAIAYGFGYNLILINAGHQTKVLAIAYLPAVLAGLITIYQGRRWLGAAMLGIAMALFVSTNHYQVMYYAIIMVTFFVISQLVMAIKKGRIKDFILSSVVALAMAVVGVGTNMYIILPTMEYTKTTMRGGESELTINKDPNKKAGGLDKDYAFRWSTGIGETFCIMIPYLYGGSVMEPIEKAPETEALVGGQAETIPLYWGPQAETGIFSGPVYFGAIICFLFVLGLMVIRSPHKWWVLAVCVLTIMMSWGKYLPSLNYALFDTLPGLNKFRSPSTVLVIPQLLFPMLAIWGLKEIIEGKWTSEELIKKLKIAAGITAGLCVLLGLGGSMFFSFTHQQFDSQMPAQIVETLKEDRAALATKSALTSAAYILVAAALIWAFVTSKISVKIMAGGLTLLIAIDMMSWGSNYLNERHYMDASDYDAVFQPRPVDQQILQDPDPYYRVLDVSKNTYNDAMQAYFHKCIGGYSPAKMEIYQDLIDVHMGGVQSQGRFNTAVLNMLNTKYIIFNGPQNQAVYQPNTDALGNAWFVEEVKWAKTADEEILAMKAGALGDTATITDPFDPSKTAVIRSSFETELAGYNFGKDSAASIKLTRYGLNDLSFVSNNSMPGLAVFSDIWYPHGWTAYVDGQETPIIKANYVLRAIKVPAGNHTIEFKFRPKSFATGNTIALICSLLLFGLLIFALVLIYRKRCAAVADK